MHDLAFRIKRAHWAGIRVFGARLAKVGLTPARFDLLYAIRNDARRSRFPQHALMRKLGISRTTVSKMVRRLVDVGLLRRERCSDFDGRTWYLSLTRRAKRALWISSYQLLRRQASHQLYECAVLTFRERRTSSNAFAEAFAILHEMEYRLGRIACLFDDRSELWYPDVFDNEL